jgi:hypothetical protein
MAKSTFAPAKVSSTTAKHDNRSRRSYGKLKRIPSIGRSPGRTPGPGSIWLPLGRFLRLRTLVRTGREVWTRSPVLTMRGNSPMPPFRRLTSIAELYNYVEVILWISLAIVVALRARRCKALRSLYLVGCAVLLAFSASDLVEARTTNEWWRPWWLLVWKATCVLAMIVLVILGRFVVRRERRP